MSEETFPDVRWGSGEPTLLRRSAEAFAASGPGSWIIRKLTPLDHRVLRRSRGRYTLLGPIGLPLLLLSTTGRKSGQRRESPLLYMRDGDRLFVIGSNFGQLHHPAWSSNLLADPKAWVTVGGREVPVLATQVSGGEYDRVWRMFADYVKVYPVYRGRTDRELRIFALTPREG
jgi:deazaflavin-dependent oxidoreductase (nitroreductase family)